LIAGFGLRDSLHAGREPEKQVFKIQAVELFGRGPGDLLKKDHICALHPDREEDDAFVALGLFEPGLGNLG
jgi:hypothetical protein